MKKKVITPLIILLWAIVPCYFFAINSFMAGMAALPPATGHAVLKSTFFDSSIFTFLLSFITLLALNFSSYFFGGMIFKLLRIDKLCFCLKRFYKIAVGYGAIFISLFILGTLGLYNNVVLSVYIIFLVCSSIAGIILFIRDLPINLSVSFSGAEAIFISVIVFVMVLDLVTAMLPPTVRDSLIHHLAVGKIYLKKGGIVPIDFMTYTFRSTNLELLYMLTIFIKNDIVSRVIHFNFYLLSVLALYHFLRDSFAKITSLIGVAIFASIPVVFNVAASAYVDIGLLFFCIMLLNAALQYYREDEKTYLILAGIMAGLSISTKVNGYLFVLLVFLWLVVTDLRRKKAIKKILISIGIVLAFTLLFDAHQVIKNMNRSKNPFYPVISLAKGESYNEDGVEVKLRSTERRKILYNMTILDEIMMPWALSTKVYSKAQYTVDGVLGPVFAIFLPFVVFLKKKRYEVYSLLAIAGIYTTVCWGRFDIRLRYLFVLFPIGVYLISCIIDEFFFRIEEGSGNPAYLNKLIVPLLIFIISLNIYHIFNYVAMKDPFSFITAREGKDEYLTKHYKRYSIFKYINENITYKNALIYFLDFGNDGYYCDLDYYYDSYFLGETFKSIVKKSRDPDEILKRMTGKGFSHVLLNKRFFNEDLSNNYDSDERQMIKEYFDDHMKIMKQIDGDEVYEIIK